MAAHSPRGSEVAISSFVEICRQTLGKGHAFGKPVRILLRELHAAQQILKARIRADWVPHGKGFQLHHLPRMPGVRSLEPDGGVTRITVGTLPLGVQAQRAT